MTQFFLSVNAAFNDAFEVVSVSASSFKGSFNFHLIIILLKRYSTMNSMHFSYMGNTFLKCRVLSIITD